MSSISTNSYLDLLNQLSSKYKVPDETVFSMLSYFFFIYRSEQQDKYSEPMLWIGMYIALASFVCVVAMVADLLHGFRNKKLWFPCKYFTINSASLTVISVAMKLPFDLSSMMPGNGDQVAKLGSMAFMCTMMANLLPSLATMDSKELLSNIVALGVFVITLVVNVCIQIHTGVVSYDNNAPVFQINESAIFKNYSYFIYSIGRHKLPYNKIIATSYVIMLIMLMIIYICSSLAILKSKKIIESKYRQVHDIASKEQRPGSLRLSVENLQEHVSKYWIMAETGSPQFITACSATTSASGVICGLSTMLHIFTLFQASEVISGLSTLSNSDYDKLGSSYGSDYKLSMLVILIIQFVGILLGTVAPLSRCFATLSFDVSIKNIWKDHIKVWEVESYWTHELSNWKQSSIPFPFRSRKCKKVIEKFKALLLSICIQFQKIVVIACKMIALIPFLCMYSVFYCFCLKRVKTKIMEPSKDLYPYVLKLDDETELADRTLQRLSKALKRLIEKGKKHQPDNLINLLDKSTGFEGVEKLYDGDDHDQTIRSNGYQDCWSLPVVTLTTIVVSLPEIPKNEVDSFLKSVSEGIQYVKLVEESLNDAKDYVNVQKAAEKLWREVEVDKTWLGNKLQDLACPTKTGDIIRWFMNKAKDMETRDRSADFGGLNDHNSICANSMYRLTKTIMLSCHDIDEVSQDELFAQLLSMISNILAACLTNLPQIITMKCHTSAIEKREANVHFAARLLGETKEILDKLQDREIPHDLKANELPFIDKWRACLRGP